MKKIINSAIFSGIVTAIVFPPQTFAYLDPGTGSYVLQVAAAVLFGGLFVVKTFWGRITHFLSNLVGKGKKTGENSSDKK